MSRNATSTDIAVNWLPSVRLLAQIEVNTAEYRRFELQHILSTTDADFEDYEHQLTASDQAHEKLVNEYEKVITRPVLMPISLAASRSLKVATTALP